MSDSGYPSGLTASAFELLIRAYWSPTAFEDWVDVGTSTQEEELLAAELINREGARRDCRLTARGLALAKFILHLPLPEAVWQIPGQRP